MTICKKTHSAVREKADLFLPRKRIPHGSSRRRFKFRVLLENLLYLSIQVMLGFEAMN